MPFRRRTAALLLLFGLLPAVAMSQTPPDSTSSDPTSSDPAPVDFRLDAQQWAHRVLLVFGPSEASGTADAQAALRAQEDAFAGHDAGFRERHLILVIVRGGGPGAVPRGTLRDAPSASPTPLTPASAARLRDRFEVDVADVRVILVGKDGTEKSRDPAPTTTRAVFDRIDAMPMRQREMRRQNDG